jgi:ketopantoate reductase
LRLRAPRNHCRRGDDFDLTWGASDEGAAAPKTAPSTLIDVENRRPSEADHIIGDLVRRADPFGIEVPILARGAVQSANLRGAAVGG